MTNLVSQHSNYLQLSSCSTLDFNTSTSRAATAGTPAGAWKWRVVSAGAGVVIFFLLSRLYYIEKVL